MWYSSVKYIVQTLDLAGFRVFVRLQVNFTVTVSMVQKGRHTMIKGLRSAYKKYMEMHA